VPTGHHIIEFRYRPPLKQLFISLTAFGLGILLLGFVIVRHFTRKPETPPASLGNEPGEP
jgi:cytochrome c-type biogenesis protein CcmH/NrfF